MRGIYCTAASTFDRPCIFTGGYNFKIMYIARAISATSSKALLALGGFRPGRLRSWRASVNVALTLGIVDGRPYVSVESLDTVLHFG